MVVGRFVEECKNRFLCLINIEGNVEECYVSSSSKLKNYINLTNKKVMLVENRGKNLRTNYTLEAVKIKGKWILLNLNLINELYLDVICKQNRVKRQMIQRERVIYDYKTDFYIEKTRTLIEIKAILSDKQETVYPIVSCGRAYRQLVSIRERLNDGYKVEYCFVLMNPETKHIILNPKDEEMRKLYKECIELGMIIKFYVVRWYAGKFRLKESPIGDVELTC